MGKITGIARDLSNLDPERPVKIVPIPLAIKLTRRFRMEGLLQPTHLILILGIALLIFGPRKLPELGQGLGKGIRDFRDAIKGVSEDSARPRS